MVETAVRDEVEGSGLRARKKERVRQQLAAAALRLMSQRGFEAVTVEDIAAEVDVSTRTFYRYFPTKEDVLLDDPSDILDRFFEALGAEPPERSAVVAVRAALIAAAARYEAQGPDNLRRQRIVDATPSLKVRQSERHTAWEQLLVPALGARLGDPADRPSLEAEVLASCAVSVMRVSFAAWRADDGRRSYPGRVAEAFDVLERAVIAAAVAPG